MCFFSYQYSFINIEEREPSGLGLLTVYRIYTNLNIPEMITYNMDLHMEVPYIENFSFLGTGTWLFPID